MGGTLLGAGSGRLKVVDGATLPLEGWAENLAMSPRFRRYLVRSLPALALVLALDWSLNRFFGGVWSYPLALGLWS